MWEDAETIRVNFGQPMPLFPLDGVVLLPHAVLPLHIFEDRYRQMVADALDGAGQIAVATFEGERWKQEYHGSPPLRPAVCVGQIIQHEALADGRYNLLLQGVCRARIAEEHTPDGEREYRLARLAPVERQENGDALDDVRARQHGLLTDAPLTSLTAAESIGGCLEREEAPTDAILELIAISVVSDSELKYRLLAEGDPRERAAMIEEELVTLRGLLRRASLQIDPAAPKGCRWN